MRKLDIVGPLGVGGTSTVSLARAFDGRGERLVALKQLHPFLRDDPAALRALEREASLGRTLKHPNLVGVLDCIDEPAAIVLEYVEGIDVAALIHSSRRRGEPLPLEVVMKIACDALAGLDAIHRAGIVHGDVSPENILVGVDGVARIADLGNAASAGDADATAFVSGKLRYLAPERLAAVFEPRSDLFALGIVLWELLTGRRGRTSDGVELLVEILHGALDAPSRFAPRAACSDALLKRALERAPEDRYATALEMRDAIVRAVPPAPASRVAGVVRSAMRAVETSPSVCA